MPHSQIDHITIAASVLASGVELVHRSLGVRPQVGGEHPRMGTHNALLRLGAPVVIEWPPAVQVARKLDDVGCALVKLEGFHPDAPRLSALLKSISVDSEAISVSPLPAGRRPYLVAHIRTPKGLATLSGA